MRSVWKKRLALGAILGLFLVMTTGSLMAQSGGEYDLSWSTIDGGGGRSTGGTYTVGGTLGQPDAGELSGGDYVLRGGFWPGGAVEYTIYLPFVLRND